MAYLTCEKCVKLWAEFEAAAKTDRDSVSLNTRSILEHIVKEIESKRTAKHRVAELA
jgi:hypothetical protein